MCLNDVTIKTNSLKLFISSTGELQRLIKTPLLDKKYSLDLSPEFIFETLNYFVNCGERLTQMTKTYDDIDALAKLLEEVSILFYFELFNYKKLSLSRCNN